MPKIDPKSILDKESDLDVIRPEAYANMLKEREKTLFRSGSYQTDAPLNLYSDENRMMFVEEDNLEEVLTLLLNLRPEDVAMVFSLMTEGAAIHSIGHRYLDGAMDRYRPHLSRMSSNYGLIVQAVIESAKANIKATKDFRGTVSARFTTGLKIRFDSQDIKLEFLAKVTLTQLTTFDMQRTFSDPANIEMAPKLVDRFTFDISIPDFVKG